MRRQRARQVGGTDGHGAQIVHKAAAGGRGEEGEAAGEGCRMRRTQTSGRFKLGVPCCAPRPSDCQRPLAHTTRRRTHWSVSSRISACSSSSSTSSMVMMPTGSKSAGELQKERMPSWAHGTCRWRAASLTGAVQREACVRRTSQPAGETAVCPQPARGSHHNGCSCPPAGSNLKSSRHGTCMQKWTAQHITEATWPVPALQSNQLSHTCCVEQKVLQARRGPGAQLPRVLRSAQRGVVAHRVDALHQRLLPAHAREITHWLGTHRF